MGVHYWLRVESSGVPIAVALNDVPLVRRDRAVELLEHANLWVRPGANTLAVRLDWAAARGARWGSGRVRVAVRVARDDSGPEETLASWEWPLPEDEWPAGVEPGAAVEELLRFEAPVPTACDLWTRAEAVGAVDAARDAVLALVRALHDGFSRPDLDALDRLMDYSVREMARARYQAAADVRAGHRGFLEAVTGARGLRLEPRVHELGAALRLNVVGEGRLLWVTREDLSPPLQGQTEWGTGFGVPLYLAKLGGTWTVAR